MIDSLLSIWLPIWNWFPAWSQVTILNVVLVVLIILPLLLHVAVLSLYVERKIIGYMQVRIGPNRVGPRGWLQPIADIVKLLLKEIIVPSKANKFLFLTAPILSVAPALVAWAVIPFTDTLVLANIDASLLFILAMTSMGIYGVIIAGWASNSKYALLGALRSAAQIVAYEIAMGFALVGVLMAANTLNLREIVLGQAGGIGDWYVWPLLPLFFVYFISGIAETNRAPFDVAEGESELVAGFHVEYSGISFGLFFLGEYANMILISALTAIMFLGGWLPPWDYWLFNLVPGFVWLWLKVAFFVFIYLWIRATFPRYRYDQIMRLGWKVLIPVTLVWIVVIGGAQQTKWGYLFH